MPSSTSASRQRRATWLLVLGCLIVAAAMEVAARVGLDRASRIQRRMVEEYREARRIGRDDPRPSVLVVGNSLLDEGIRFDRLRGALGDRYDTKRYMVEQTVFYDWYYGLRRLYREGARPDVVLVMLGTGHWLSAGIRGDYSAQYLVHLADLPLVARDLRMHPTQATGLAFAGLSKFWGARVEMRNFVLGHLMPDVGRLMTFSMAGERRPMIADAIEPVLRERVARLRALADTHGSTLVVLVPPVLDPEDGADVLVAVASATGVPVLRPVVSGSFGPGMFRDGFHLNDTGAVAFTEQLIPALAGALRAVEQRAHADPGGPHLRQAAR